MDELAFQKKLADLVEEIGELPDEDRLRFLLIAEHSKDRHEKIRKTVNNLQDSIDFLRLSIKYLMFDLEATRRENMHLRKLIENQSDEPPESGPQS